MGGPLLDAASFSPSNGRADLNYDGAKCLRDLLTVNTTAVGAGVPLDALDLPGAVDLANVYSGPHTINFDTTIFATPQTITLTGGPLALVWPGV